MEKNNIYETFKFFKNYYVQFNIAKEVCFIGDQNNNKIDIVFSKDSEFYILKGSIDATKFPENQFFDWVLKQEDGYVTVMNINEFIGLGKVLKKNAISLNDNGNNFTFEFIDKETGQTNSIVVYSREDESYIKIYDHACNIEHAIKYEELPSVEVPENVLESDILQLHLTDEGDLDFFNRDGYKIIELPVDRIKSILKNSKVELSFNNTDSCGRRFVQVSSKNEDNVELSQFFVTI